MRCSIWPETPLTAEEIAETLAMARSNVSNSLKELQGWGLVRRVPVLGDRRDHFEADTDIWSIAAKIAAGRKERELDPAIAALEACVAEAAGDARLSATAAARLSAMLDFTRTMTGWFDQMSKVPKPTLMALIRLGARIASFLRARKPNRGGRHGAAERSGKVRDASAFAVPRRSALPRAADGGGMGGRCRCRCGRGSPSG